MPSMIAADTGGQRDVLILLATYNGALYLDEQLASIETQQGVGRIDILASDDGSTDTTRVLLEGWAARWSRGSFDIRPGPGAGFSENFRHLMVSATGAANFIAFADQDDIWDADKLSTAIDILAQQAADRPGLYFSRTRLVDAKGAFMGYSPLFRRQPAFENAIVQSIGGGNTVVLNAPAFALLAESARRTGFQTHDWWTYMLIAGAGGYVHYDATAHIGYRQHGANVIGKNTGVMARLSRIGQLLDGRFANWTERNLTALEACSDLLTPAARQTLQNVREARQTYGPLAYQKLRMAGIFRQTMLGNLALIAAAMLGKL